ncbi:hypothetical protein [uncultured Fusobacterium sp.]|jgi:hypothetical protein|uniref:hypothetical protein n=1 Tax=uncultured Fusobacterium sp. TaxID=159267 RepID=UPI00265F7F0C|nr:hypothetical protein [uncultured Fusobacterium sp.]
MTYEEIYKLRNSCITEEELEEIRESSCCYKIEKNGNSPYLPMEYYKIIFWKEEDIEVAVVQGGN